MSNRALARRPLLLLETVGRAMMDLGIGSFIEKIEDHFGRGWAKAMLIFFGLVAVAVGAPIIWNFLFKPLVVLVVGFMPGEETQQARDLAKFFVFVSLVMVGINYALQIFDRRLQIKITRQYGLRIRKAKDALEDLERQLAEANEELKRIQEKKRR